MNRGASAGVLGGLKALRFASTPLRGAPAAALTPPARALPFALTRCRGGSPAAPQGWLRTLNSLSPHPVPKLLPMS
jgi:hypothetical protein